MLLSLCFSMLLMWLEMDGGLTWSRSTAGCTALVLNFNSWFSKECQNVMSICPSVCKRHSMSFWHPWLAMSGFTFVVLCKKTWQLGSSVMASASLTATDHVVPCKQRLSVHCLVLSEHRFFWKTSHCVNQFIHVANVSMQQKHCTSVFWIMMELDELQNDHAPKQLTSFCFELSDVELSVDMQWKGTDIFSWKHSMNFQTGSSSTRSNNIFFMTSILSTGMTSSTKLYNQFGEVKLKERCNFPLVAPCKGRVLIRLIPPQPGSESALDHNLGERICCKIFDAKCR